MVETLPSVPKQSKSSEAVPVGRDTQKAKLEALKSELPDPKDKATADELARTLDQSSSAGTVSPEAPQEPGFLDSMKALVATLTGEVKHLFEQLFGKSSGVSQVEAPLTAAPQAVFENRESLEDPEAPVCSLEKGVKGIVTSEFGLRENPFKHGELDDHAHAGVDISAPLGTSIYATHEGVIVAPHSSSNETIRLVDGREFTMRHLSKEGPAVGTVIHPGDLLGKVGNVGRSTGPHLHLEARVNGQLVDPTPYLGAEMQSQAQLVASNQKAKVDSIEGGSRLA